MVKEVPRGCCGDCKHFDVFRNTGEPVGRDAQNNTLGFCRTEKGLQFMALPETAVCRQESTKTFQPKHEVKTPITIKRNSLTLFRRPQLKLPF